MWARLRRALATVDAGEAWAPETVYKAGEAFTHNVTQTSAVDANGDRIAQGLGLFAYPTAQTSGPTSVLTEIAKWVPVAGSGGNWVNGPDIATNATIVAIDRTSFIYALIPETENAIDISGMSEGAEIEILVHPQANIGDVTLNVIGGNIISFQEGVTNGANATIKLTRGSVVRLRKRTIDLWVVSQHPDSKVEPFGNAQISVLPPVAEGDREHITVTSFSQSGFGISNYLFHLSDDRNIVGTLAGGSITLEPNVPLDLYLVGPVTAGAGDGDLQHNGTVEGIHFTVTFDGVGLVYEIVESVRHHPGPGDFDTRSYQSVVDNQTIPLTIVENNFGLLFDGLAISTKTDTLYQGVISGAAYDFTVFPPPTTGNDFIDSSPTDISGGTHFIADGNGSFQLFGDGGAFVTYPFSDGDLITILNNAANFPNAVLNVNQAINDITQQISGWSLLNGALPPVSDNRYNSPVAVLEDPGAGAASYSLVRDDAFENNAVDATRTFRIRVARNLPDIASTLATRFFGLNNSLLFIDPILGTASAEANVTILSTSVSDASIEVVFRANADTWTSLRLHPVWGNSGSTASTNALTGKQYLIAMDIDHVVADSVQVNNAIGLMTTQIEDPALNDDLVMDHFHQLSGSVTINATNDQFTLPQSAKPYVLKASLGFDFDGAPSDAWEVSWFNVTAGVVVPDAIEAQFRPFKATDDDASQPEFFNPTATAVLDASAGPVVVSLRVTDAATDADITRATVEIEQKPVSSTIITDGVQGLTALPADGGVLTGANEYLANHSAPITLTIDPAMLVLSKIVIEDFNDMTLTNTVSIGTASDTFNGVAGPMGIDSGTGEYVITKTAANTYLWRAVV